MKEADDAARRRERHRRRRKEGVGKTPGPNEIFQRTEGASRSQFLEQNVLLGSGRSDGFFIDDEGRVNEVDCLVLTPAGLILIEIKSRPGTVQGDPHTWTWTTDGRRYSDDNPLALANRKAKRLASILRKQGAFSRSHARTPWVEAVIFLSAVRGALRIDPGSTHKVFLRGAPRSDTDSGIIAAITGTSNAGLV